MRYGFVIPTGDPRTVAELAHQLEAHGWDGAFTWGGIALDRQWDHVGGYVSDPWVVLAAMAMRTERVRLGALVTPPSRRRPWKLARETMTLDYMGARGQGPHSGTPRSPPMLPSIGPRRVRSRSSSRG